MQIDDKWKNVLIMVATIIGVYLSIKYILPLILPFALAYLLVTAILPIVNFFNKKFNIPKTIAAIGILLFIVGILFAGLWILLINVIEQIKRLFEELPSYSNHISEMLDSICSNIDSFFKLNDGMAREVTNINLQKFADNLTNNLMPQITEHTKQIVFIGILIIGIFFIICISVILIIKDMGKMKAKIRHSDFFEDIRRVYKTIAKAGLAYLRAEGIIMTIVGSSCVIMLAIMGNSYALLIGIGIAVVDVLPIFGSGTILIPWSIISLINGNIKDSAILLVLYIITSLIRQFLEPKLIGEKIGIMPLYTIMAMYIGVQLFGVTGFILGPVGLLIIRAILDEDFEVAG